MRKLITIMLMLCICGCSSKDINYTDYKETLTVSDSQSSVMVRTIIDNKSNKEDLRFDMYLPYDQFLTIGVSLYVNVLQEKFDNKKEIIKQLLDDEKPAHITFYYSNLGGIKDVEIIEWDSNTFDVYNGKFKGKEIESYYLEWNLEYFSL